MRRIIRQSGQIAALVAATWGCSLASAAADPFVLDKGYTALTFSWSHFGVSRQSARFNGIDGTADIDPQNPENSKVDVTIRTNSVQSGSDTFDRILRSPDYFNAATYPTISFKSQSVNRTGEKTADVVGDLNILGKSQPVTLHVTLNILGDHPSSAANPTYLGKKVAGFSATTQIKRSEWGMSKGTPMISDEVDITIETELVSAN